MATINEILQDIRRGEKALSSLYVSKSNADRFGVSFNDEAEWFLRNSLPTLKYRVEVLELADELAQALHQQLIGVIGESDPVVKVLINWGYYNTAPDVNAITYQFSRMVDTGSGSFSLDFTQAAENKYIAFSQPVAEPDKTKWFNTALNNGVNIPDATFNAKSIISGREIVTSRDPFIFQSTVYNVTFST